tara:strand:- start:5538 stop:6692 length:1155 start_codon:yes stop_codon:yes gene_type:complete
MGTITRGIANNILGSGAVDGTDGLSGTVPANNIANASLNNITSLPPSVDAGIPSVAGNPPSPSDGDVWYNSVTYKLRVRGVSAPAGSWASGTNINTARNYAVGIGATSGAAIAVGGTPPDNSYDTKTESWNGSSWTEVNDVNTGRFGAVGAGASYTSGLIAMGYTGATPPSNANTTKTETWNGTNWTETGDLNTKRQDGGGFGTQTSAVVAGGYKYVPSGGRVGICESWNGSAWTEVADLNTVRYKLSESGAGADNTSGIIAGGDVNPPTQNTTKTEEWNGSSWTEVGDMNLARDNLGATGIATAALAFGGETDSPDDEFYAQTEVWNGTSWSEIGDLNSGRTRVGSAGTTASAMAMGGNPGTGIVATVETWTGGVGNLDVTLS